MNARLRSLVDEAESLPDADQERLVEIIRGFIDTHAALSPREQAALEWVLSQHDPDAPEPTDEEMIAWAKEQEHLEADFTPEELEHIRKLEDEPFVPADPETLARLFAHRG